MKAIRTVIVAICAGLSSMLIFAWGSSFPGIPDANHPDGSRTLIERVTGQAWLSYLAPLISLVLIAAAIIVARFPKK